jgi:RNA polymerase sigma-70 factor (ECF subfamily)
MARDATLETRFRQLNPPLVRYLSARGAEDPEGLAGDVWMEAMRWGSLDDTGFRRMMYTIAGRRLIDQRRRRGLRERVQRLSRRDAEPVPGLIDEAAAFSIIRSLPAKQAEVVFLRVVCGLAAEDVAAITDSTPGAVRVIQHRALRRLAKDLEQNL